MATSEGEDLRHDDELEVDRHGHAEGVGHGLLGQERRAQVAVEDVGDPRAVLRHEALVEPQLVQQHGARRRGVVGPEDGQGGVAGQEVDEEEGEDRDEEADDDQLDEPGGDEAEHGRRGAQALRHDRASG